MKTIRFKFLLAPLLIVIVLAAVSVLFISHKPHVGRAAFFYRNNITEANDYKLLLKEHGIDIDLISIFDAETLDYSKYKVLLIGDDIYRGNVNLEDIEVAVVSAIDNSKKPIVGLGGGGYYFFGRLGLSIGYPWGRYAYRSGIYIVNASHQIFSSPKRIDTPVYKIIQLYSSPSGQHGIFLPSTEDFNDPRYAEPVERYPFPPVDQREDVILFGRETISPVHYSLVLEKDRYLLWGFTEPPRLMTQTGKDLFFNVVYWL